MLVQLQLFEVLQNRVFHLILLILLGKLCEYVLLLLHIVAQVLANVLLFFNLLLFLNLFKVLLIKLLEEGVVEHGAMLRHLLCNLDLLRLSEVVSSNIELDSTHLFLPGAE